jgi:hypothetical protein
MNERGGKEKGEKVRVQSTLLAAHPRSLAPSTNSLWEHARCIQALVGPLLG